MDVKKDVKHKDIKKKTNLNHTVGVKKLFKSSFCVQPLSKRLFPKPTFHTEQLFLPSLLSLNVYIYENETLPQLLDFIRFFRRLFGDVLLRRPSSSSPDAARGTLKRPAKKGVKKRGGREAGSGGAREEKRKGKGKGKGEKEEKKGRNERTEKGGMCSFCSFF